MRQLCIFALGLIEGWKSGSVAVSRAECDLSGGLHLG
jgi:hypothetical protein